MNINYTLSDSMTIYFISFYLERKQINNYCFYKCSCLSSARRLHHVFCAIVEIHNVKIN